MRICVCRLCQIKLNVIILADDDVVTVKNSREIENKL